MAVAKVTINGEAYEYDGALLPVAEAIVIEDELGLRLDEWRAELAAGSVRALAAYCWQVLNRNGERVTLADILSGAYPVNLSGLKIEAAEVAGG